MQTAAWALALLLACSSSGCLVAAGVPVQDPESQAAGLRHTYQGSAGMLHTAGQHQSRHLLAKKDDQGDQIEDDLQEEDDTAEAAADKAADKIIDKTADKITDKTADKTVDETVSKDADKTKDSSASPSEAKTEAVAGSGEQGAPVAAKPKPSNRTKKAPVVQKPVTFAPEANVTFGDDIDDEGKCAIEIQAFCKDEEEGESKLADCISDAITAAENPEGATEGVPPAVSDDCREEVYQYKISRNSNINKNVPLAKACKVDADKFCNVTWFFGYKSGQVISCLKDMKGQVSKGCKQQLFKVQMDAAQDIRADPLLWEACQDDSKSLCKDVKYGNGRVQKCLRDKRMQLSWGCEEQLFRQEMENADDIRLSVRLFFKCLPDKRKFCADVEPGNARTKDCLEAHREELSNDCKEEVDDMILRRVRDFRLDVKLRTTCETEINSMCAYFGDMDDLDTFDASIINCLQDYAGEMKNDDCKQQVKKYVALAAQDIRFDVPLAEACYEDRQKFCAKVPPGSARVIRCLSIQREKLSSVCRATLFDEEVRFSENIDFQYPMKDACKEELRRFCKDVPHGNARAIRCLQDNKGGPDFGEGCKTEVEAYEAEVSKDYRLNFRLAKNCDKDVQSLCPNMCNQNDGSVCGGKVLRCLTDNIDAIKAEDCRKEVFYYEKMEVENYRNDIILADACRTDVEQFCVTVKPGEGRVHKCLRDNRDRLSAACRTEELLLEEKEASNIELSGGLLRACKTERQLFCKEVAPGSARVFRCLAENMNDADFSGVCKHQVINKLQRRQSNWKLDPPLRKACRKDVTQLCRAEDAVNGEDGKVYKCLISNIATVSQGCQKEVGRAVHMAFYVWQPGAVLTAECDDDIQRYCIAARPNMAQRPGAVGSCLASILEKQDRAASSQRRQLDETGPEPQTLNGVELSDAGDEAAASLPARTSYKALQGARLSDSCNILADIAEPPNMKQAFDASLSFALLKSQLDKLDAVTGIPLVTRDRRGTPQAISLTGWMAMTGLSALVALVVTGSFMLYKRWRGIPDRDYTLVVKQQPK